MEAVASTFLLSQFFLAIFSVENIPLPASNRYWTGEGLDFLAYDFVQVIFTVEKLPEDVLSFSQRTGFVGVICQIAFPKTVYDEVSEMENSVFG